MRRVGIARLNHWLVYRITGGNRWQYFVPRILKSGTVRIWNFFACRMYGHGDLVQEFEAGPIFCSMCNRKVKGADPETAIQEWRH